MAQFSEIVTATLQAMEWGGSLHQIPTLDGLQIRTTLGRYSGHRDISRPVVEGIINNFRGDLRFTKIYEYIRKCTEIAVTVALQKCFEGVVGPYINIGSGI